MNQRSRTLAILNAALLLTCEGACGSSGQAKPDGGGGAGRRDAGTGTVADTGGGAGGAGSGAADAAPLPTCPSIPPPSATITAQGTGTGTALVFSPDGGQWGSYQYAAPGQPTPVATATADGNGIAIAGSFSPADGGGNFAGVGLYFTGTNCLDASAYTGIKFDFAGDLGGCALALGSASSADLDSVVNLGRGTCSAAAGACYGPSAAVTPGTTTIMVAFATLAGGMPVDTLDPSTLLTVQWQLSPPASGTCAADFTVSNVAFY